MLTGERIHLRPVTLDDVTDRYVRWMNDAEVTRFLEVRWAKQTAETIRAYVQQLLSKSDEPFFAICVNGTGEHLGNIKLGPINPHHRTADVSLVIGEKAWWGKGIATEAIRLVTAHAFDELGLRKLKAGCYAENLGSAHAFERCGWRREGLQRAQAICDGKETDVILLGIRAGEHRGDESTQQATTTKVVAVLQARASSSRLPGKVLLPILGQPMLLRQIERVRRAKRIDALVVASSTDPSDDPIEAACKAAGLGCFRGSLDDVLDRFYQAARPFRPEHVVRLTGDCPLAEPEVIDLAVERHLREGADFTSNALEPTYPDGLDVEVARWPVLETAWREATLKSHREHVMPFIHSQPQRFKRVALKQERDLSKLRWTVDEPQDFAVVKAIYEALYPTNPAFGMNDVLALLEQKPELGQLNSKLERNEGHAMSIKKENLGARYQASQAWLERAQKTIPLGSQTFSKSRTHYPKGVSPHYVARGKAAHVWDLDGNEFIDFVNGLCAVTLGYDDPDVTAAVKAQLESGVIFSLPHPLEAQVAEKICELVPCAQMVRFGKNGSDATAGAIRIARGFTKRDHVAVCGYHGWQDWYIGSTARNLGVPQATRDLTHTFAYNDLGSLEKIFAAWPGQVAAVILEPMNVADPAPGWLQAVKELTHRHGALLVFDETITGFRFANGGAQELFGVTPDLATFGKGMANGYPLSAVAGRRDVMMLMEEVFFSFTNGGETLSLAAALASMQKLQREPVTRTLAARGNAIIDGARELIGRHRLGDVFSVSGHPSWSFLNFRDAGGYTVWQIKTLFLQEVFARGILTVGSHNLSWAHTDADVQRLLGVYDEVFALIRRGLDDASLPKLLMTTPLEPLFKVR